MSEHITYAIIGDVHEQVYSLRQLLKQIGYSLEDDRIENREGWKLVLVGDYLDKDVRTAETVDFMYRNIDRITMLIGNHERWIYRYFFDPEFKVTRSEEYIDKYFTSLKYLEQDEDARMKFKHVFERSVPFFETEKFIVTHAPVKKKYLGKSDRKSVSHQINLRRNWDDPNEATRFLTEEADDADKLHVFGHIAMQQVERYKNKIGIDTGAYAGNKLTALIIHPHGELEFSQVHAIGGDFFDKNFQTIFN